MSYTIIMVGSDGSVILSEIIKDKISDFFKKERKMFVGKISELSSVVVGKIMAEVGRTDNLGFADLTKVESLAKEKQRPDVLRFIEFLRSEYSCQYLVSK